MSTDHNFLPKVNTKPEDGQASGQSFPLNITKTNPSLLMEMDYGVEVCFFLHLLANIPSFLVCVIL